MSNKVSGPCPKCKGETLHLNVKQGDSMRITGGPTLRVGITAELFCVHLVTNNGGFGDEWCDYRESSVTTDIILEFGEAA